jgi:hypothetical protein
MPDPSLSWSDPPRRTRISRGGPKARPRPEDAQLLRLASGARSSFNQPRRTSIHAPVNAFTRCARIWQQSRAALGRRSPESARRPPYAADQNPRLAPAPDGPAIVVSHARRRSAPWGVNGRAEGFNSAVGSRAILSAGCRRAQPDLADRCGQLTRPKPHCGRGPPRRRLRHCSNAERVPYLLLIGWDGGRRPKGRGDELSRPRWSLGS